MTCSVWKKEEKGIGKGCKREGWRGGGNEQTPDNAEGAARASSSPQYKNASYRAKLALPERAYRQALALTRTGFWAGFRGPWRLRFRYISS